MKPHLVSELSEAAALPRLHGAARRALNRVYGDAPALPLAAGRIEGALRFVFSDEPARGVEPHGRFGFRLGPHAGCLAIDSVGLAALIGEPRIELLPRELRTILLAEALQPLVERLQAASRLRFEWRAESGDLADTAAAEAAPLCFAVQAAEGPGVRGFIAFDDPAAWEAALPAFSPARRAAGSAFDTFVVPLHFELGRTTIAWQELRGVAPGDIVGIERWRAAGSALHVQARAGGLLIDALADGTRLTLQHLGDSPMTPTPETATADAAQLPLDRLDAMEVTLRFEVGGLQLTLGELKGLKPGHVFELDEPLNRSTVRILAHGNVLGKGHLVAVGDRLGVRVAEFAAGAL